MRAGSALVMALGIAVSACSEKGKGTVSHNGATPSAGAAVASARAHGLELRATASGAVIDAELINVGEMPVTVVSRASGPDRIHYDAFVVRMTGNGAARELRFTGDRNASDTPLVTLAPGQSASHRLDLQDWSTAPINPGGRLAAGVYRATLVYRTTPGGTWWVGELSIPDLPIIVP